ncbi:hypothetical protein [Micromonospora sp. NPDC000668]|uniref:hypothetical protein n=1 Tax=Micromonospora sp. NPDC000668 TaxID=3364219 RepID=UPI0036963B3E
MLSSLRKLLIAARLRPRRPYWLGTPLRATIAAAACGGYILLIDYAQGTEWVSSLTTRMEEYDRPDEREFAAVAAALAARGLIRTTAWQIDAYGRLCAPIAVIRTGKESR